MVTDTAPITIRPAYADDHTALARLAALDSAERVPAMPILLAEVDDQVSVALSLADGSVIADPFIPTAAIVELLRRHALAIQPAKAARRGGLGVRRRRRHRLGFQHG